MRRFAFSAVCVFVGLPVRLHAVTEAAPVKTDPFAAMKQMEPASRTLGLVIKPFAVSPQVQNGTALTVDDQGKVYVCETYRFANGVEDNRAHTNWIMDDLAVHSLAERRIMLEKHAGELAPGYFTAQADRVVRVVDRDGDGVADESLEFAGGFRDMVEGPAIGILSGLNENKDLYLTCAPKLWRLKDADGDGKAEAREALLEGLGIRTSLSGHDLHGLVWGPDGLLYFSMGDRGYNFTTKEGVTFSSPDTGAAFRCRPDGTGVEMIYHGLRNPQELAFNEAGDLFTVDNNCDQGDGARICYLMEGGESGWHIGHQALTTYKAYLKEGGFSQLPHWMSEKLWQPAHKGQPKWILPPLMNFTDGPAGLTFTSGLSLPDRYQNSFFICDYKGSPSQCFLWNFKVSPDGAGYKVQDGHLFHAGMTNSDADFGPDGKLYVLDFGGGWAPSGKGAVYTMAWPEGQGRPVVSETAALLQRGLTGIPAEGLTALLGHPDQRVRLRASYAMASLGDKALPAVVAYTAKAEGVACWTGIWTLGQLKAVEPIRKYLTHANPETRAQAARTLGQLEDAGAAPAIQELLFDPSRRVSSLAAIAMGRLKVPSAMTGILFLIGQGSDDPFVRHSTVMALTGCATPAELTALSTHSSSKVRLAAVLALRRLKHEGAARFLTDEDSDVAGEALRAIADAPIPAARPALRASAQQLPGSPKGAFLTDEVQFRRILRSLQVEGNAEAARTLADLAAAASLTPTQRLLAIRTLQNFVNPPPIDPTNGLWRPLPPREVAMVRHAVEEPLARLLDEAPGEIKAPALTFSVDLGIPVAPAKLTAWVSDDTQPLALRLSALAKLPAGAALTFAGSEVPEIRAAAGQQAAAGLPDKAAGLAAALIQKAAPSDLLGAYAILTTAGSPPAVALLVNELDRLASGTVPEAVRLDLIEAAAQRPEAAVKEKLAAYETTLGQSGHSVFDLTLQGGDVARGREVFANQGTCLKCHRAEGEGGNAGPRLTGLALRAKPAYVLESIVNPNAVIVPGFGMAVFTRTDGNIVVGTVMEDLPDEVTVRTAEGEKKVLPKASIKEQSPAVSPMPPLGLSLSKRDLRDLMAFLGTLTTPLPVLK